MIRRAGPILIPVVLLALTVTACGRDATTPSAGCASPTGQAPPAALARVMDLTDVLVVSEYSPDPGSLSLTGVVTLPVGDAVERVRQELLDSGWEILQLDDEGFEAEFYAVTRRGVAGVRLRETDCTGQTKISVSVDWD